MHETNRRRPWLLTCLALVAASGCASSDPVGTLPAAPAAQVVKTAGDLQQAQPGTTLAVAPQVAVYDATSAPLPDVEIACTVSTGSGAIAAAKAVTGPDGRASCGPWTLGAGVGLQRLTVRVASLPGVIFSATSARTSPQLAVNPLTPSPNAVVDVAFPVAVVLDATYTPSSVVASVGQGPVSLSPGLWQTSPAHWMPAWIGTVAVGALPLGRLATLVVTATDVMGNVADAVVPVLPDPPPTLTVSAPLHEARADPTLSVSVSCSDPVGGCALLEVLLPNGDVALSATSHASGTIDLTAYEGQGVTLTFEGTDVSSQHTRLTRHVFVESSAQLLTRAAVDGPVQDVASTRVLFLDLGGPVPALKVTDTTTGATATVLSAPALASELGAAFLGPAGAIFSRGDRLLDWRGGAIADVAHLTGALKVAGRWAAYHAGVAPTTIHRRDLASGTSTLVGTGAGTLDVASNGEVVYSIVGPAPGWNVHRWYDGAAAPITSDADSNVFPVTDGVNVAFVRNRVPDVYDVVVHDGLDPTVLASAMPRAVQSLVEAGRANAVAGGHAAFLARDALGTFQVWRWSAAGGSHQVTSFAASSAIDGLGPDGTVLLTKGNRRYRAAPGAAPVEVGSSLGRVVHRDGRFLVLLGGAVLELQ